MDAPTIAIVTAAAKPNINLIWEAMGLGPNTFSVRLCAVSLDVTPQTVPTHFLMQDMGAQQSDVDVWSAMAQSNDLPLLPTGTVWGQNDVISSEDAQAAISGGNLFIFPAYGLVTPEDRANWLAGALAGLNLQFIPDEV